jgi:choline dehydrogenase-like flavoprotein
MLEEGPYVPGDEAAPRASEAFAQSWRCGGLTAALSSPSIVYAEGRCVGGGTEINSAIFQRVNEELVDEWAGRYQIADFTPDILRPFYDRAAKAVNASSTPGPLGRPSEILRQGSEALGWKVSQLERGHRTCVGTNMCSFVCPTGAKQSMSVTLIPKAIRRGMRLIADCRVTRLDIKSGRVIGAVGRARDASGNRHRVRVRANNVFLCAGAIHTPALLHRSGVGGRIGHTLRVHPTIRAIAVFDEPIDAHLSRLPLYAITEFMPNQRIGGSIFSPALFAMMLAEDWSNRARLFDYWRNAGIYYGMIRPKGMGRIHTLPFANEPLVTYRHDRSDLASLSKVALRLAQAMFCAGARLVIPAVIGQKGWSNPREAAADLATGSWATKASLMTIHLFSSCPPGQALENTVTDSFGRLRGLSNLIIADASQIPDAPGCNPQATVMAMAFRNAECFQTSTPRERSRMAFRES